MYTTQPPTTFVTPFSSSFIPITSTSTSILPYCPQRRPVGSAFPGGPAPVTMSAAFTANVFERFFRIIRSNVNALLSGMEDPEKIIEQTMQDMQNDLVKVRQAYAEVSASTKRLQRQRDQAKSLVDQWMQRAQLALTKGDEGLAREALVKKKTQQEIVTSLEAQLDVMEKNTQVLYEKMNLLDQKISEARLKKDQYIARAKTAKTSQKVNEMIGTVNTSGALEAFERMKEKVESLETQAEVTAELTGAPDASLEGRFRALEAGSVDDELSKMKQKLNGTTPWTLPSKDPSIENELERMKRDRGMY